MARNQVNVTVTSAEETRLRGLAATSVRDMRSLAMFALRYTQLVLTQTPERTDELADLAAQPGRSKQINFSIPPAMQALLEEIREFIEDTNGQMFIDSVLLRTAFALWLREHDDTTLIDVLGAPYPRSA